MDSPDYSSDNFGSSDEEIRGTKPSGRPMTLRGRQRKRYNKNFLPFCYAVLCALNLKHAESFRLF